MIRHLTIGNQHFDLSRSIVMGILNTTPDSFSDGGRFDLVETAVEHALRMEREGADIIDIGGESTRPGAQAVTVNEELERVIPVIRVLRKQTTIPISIDTSKPEVMQAAVEAGADMVNDVNALRAPGALEAARASAVPVCLMHMHGDPRTMQADPHYADVVAEVKTFLLQRVAACEAAGIGRQRLLLDPGFGFGKTVEHNLQLLARLEELAATGLPVVVGLSRKSMIGKLLGLDIAGRLPASIALAVLAVERGARLVRAHDVAATWQAVQMQAAVQRVQQR